MMSSLMSFAAFVTIIVTLCLQPAVASFTIKSSAASQPRVIDRTVTQKEMQEDVVRLWEQAITAKGGRARLYAVRNMVISGRADYITHKGRKNQVRREDLFVFPNKYWFYEDYGSDVFGIRMDMWDYDNKMGYAGSPGHPETRLEPIKADRNKGLNYPEIALLLETKWLKPVLVKARSERIGSSKADVVETIIDGQRVDFAFDHETHLPVRVSFHHTYNNKTYVDVQRFSDYVEVSGIRVPQTVKFDDGTVQRSIIQFNVEYDESIFIKPPPVGAGPGAWRLKGKM